MDESEVVNTSGTVTFSGVPTITGITTSSNPATSTRITPGTLNGYGGSSIAWPPPAQVVPQESMNPVYHFRTSPAIISFGTDKGRISIFPDGHVEYPSGLDEAARAFWEKMAEIAADSLLKAVRREAANAVRKLLPQLLPGLDDYSKETIPAAIASAIEKTGA